MSMRRFELLAATEIVFGYSPSNPVLHEVTVTLAEHEVLAILGSNGAGKSTLIKLLSGTHLPWSGTIRLAGESVGALPAWDRVGRGLACVPSGRSVFVDQTVSENLRLGAYHYRKDKRRVEANLASMLERFEVLGPRRDRRADTLSGGEQQILCLARGLMARPKLLLLDEPSMGLGPVAVDGLRSLLLQLKEEGTTMLMVEKLPSLAAEVSDRMAVMHLGRIIAEGSSVDVANDPAIARAYLGAEGLVRANHPTPLAPDQGS